jgi:lysozyme
MVHSAQGEDRSSYQRVTAWRGNSFGICKATEGTSFVDPTFAANWANLRKERKVRGAYHFFHPALDPAKQAQHFVSVVKAQHLKPGDMLIADVEVLSGARGILEHAGDHARQRSAVPVTGTMGATSIGTEAKRFLDEVRSLVGPHNPILVYTNHAVGALLGPCTDYPLWIAAPGLTAPTDVSPWKTWHLWQWQFGGGPGGGDKDAFNGNRAAMAKWIASYRKPRRKRTAVATWAADGTTTLAQLAATQHTAMSTILRLSAEHGAAKPKFTAEVSAWLDEALAGAPALPKGLVLVIPKG